MKGSDTRSHRRGRARTRRGRCSGRLLIYTIPLTAVSFAIGLVLALVTALARMSSQPAGPAARARLHLRHPRHAAAGPALHRLLRPRPDRARRSRRCRAAILALSLNVGGYAAEIIRASILSVPRGQYEAATTIGMGYPQPMRRIVLPQAARIAVPPLSNTLLSLIKDTSLASVILVPELLQAGDERRVAERASSCRSTSSRRSTTGSSASCVSLAQEPLETRLGRYAA